MPISLPLKAGITRRDARARHAGFTLVEILLIVAVIGVMSGVAIVSITNMHESTRVSKLTADVATINAAIQVYAVNGGTLPATATPQQILDKLKTRADSSSAATIAGLHGSVVDRRLHTEMQTSSEGAGTQTRALWDTEKQRFVIATNGGIGVKNFLLDDSLAATDPGTESRTATVKTGSGGWVWDYADVAPTARGGTGAAAGTFINGTGPTLSSPGTLPLDPPTFTPTGGAFHLISFPLSISLSDPTNNPGTSQIIYSAGGGSKLYLSPITATPGMGVTAYARSSDLDHWTDSAPVTHTYTVIPVNLSVSLASPAASLTYAQAGGAMTSGTTQTPAPATVTLNSIPEIPSAYLTSTKFQIYYTYGGANPLTTGTAGPSFSGSYVSPSIPTALGNWGSASSLVITAAARAIDTTMFASSPAVATTINITRTALTSPVIDPPSGSKATDLPVSIATASGSDYPVGYRIYYTLDGTDPGNTGGEPTSGTLYTGSFNSGAGTNGVVVVNARVYGPAGYGQWFTPSATAANTYNTITLADGALVGSANLNGTFVGSLVYAAPSSGTMNSITFNSGARIMSGNLYLPGTPTIRRTNGTTWSAANDSLFASVIQGWEFDSSGTKTVQTTPRVIDENGSVTPNNYSVTFNNSALLEGKVVRRHNSPAFPTIAPPAPPDSSGSTSLNSPPATALSASQYSSITINSSNVGDVSLNSGHYANLTANNGTSFVLGDPLHPDVTQYYSIQSLNLNSSSDIKIVGKVIITVAGTINLNSGSVLGDPDHPEWLQLQFSSGNMNANSGSSIYGQLVAPTGTVTFNAGSIFQGSVTTQSLTINSSSVVFNLPPVISN
jgi:type II secretory pathway pseudopilin PulG